MCAGATALVLFADPSWSVFGIVGSLVLAFVVTFGSFSLLRLLLTRPARRSYEDRPGVDVRRTWGFGPFDPGRAAASPLGAARVAVATGCERRRPEGQVTCSRRWCSTGGQSRAPRFP
jgi:hypothetical protein